MEGRRDPGRLWGSGFVVPLTTYLAIACGLRPENALSELGCLGPPMSPIAGLQPPLNPPRSNLVAAHLTRNWPGRVVITNPSGDSAESTWTDSSESGCSSRTVSRVTRSAL